ncbi:MULTISPECIES: hypothetical protein [Clostridium]|uniref:Uncharacterized protein n=2 Tax=Clostridium TaxID=1485 RepID=A0AAV3VXG4_9CLOT|nr:MULTISPECIES: hypothetical protein [Clostridium]ALB44426.1 hypothetical protein X276_03585 [Clostridium beijerinckii NRRL B-598]AVK48384.1 hypothetical protein AXY43_10255 [Clostridium sp. MF28]MBC2458780.1 hypothetical protein [Clostridium beijerinckii]MBC2473530.1 hypothetical protein [Clostridium beijerinckii]MBN7573156.1 hypothetical protein [Clostridium beijerinckii]
MRIGELEIAIIDIITFTGILITLLTGVLNLFQNKKTLYINNITRFRVIWITTLRTHIASLKELSNITNLYIRTKDGSNKIEYRRELDKIVSLIKMHLNFTGKLDIELILKVEELKATLNSYLLIYYCKNAIKSAERNEDITTKFYEAIDVISEKKILKEFLVMANSYKNVENKNNINLLNLLELKNEVKSAYSDELQLINNIVEKSDYIVSNYENEIESLNRDIDELVQICLKAEWIRCKVETRIWPYNKYDEERVITKLKDEYKNIRHKMQTYK